VKLRLSAITLALGSALVTSLGVYFVLFRPPLLPEDLRYLDRSREPQSAVTASQRGQACIFSPAAQPQGRSFEIPLPPIRSETRFECPRRLAALA